MEEKDKIPFKNYIYSRRCFMSGEYCSKQANIQKEREELHNAGEINAFVIMNFSNMSDVVYNWRLKPFIERLAGNLEISTKGIYCKESPGKKEKMKREEIKKRLKDGKRVPVQNINVIRADTNYASNYVVCNRICQQMQIADLIVVDVSSENTNVFYEFGMAVALGKAILPICYSESFFEIQIPDKLKEFEETDGEKETKREDHRREVERVKRHIDCYPWRRILFEHYGLRYRSSYDSTKLNADKIEIPSEEKKEERQRALAEQECGYHSKVQSTQYLVYEDAIELNYGFSDIQYTRFPYAEIIPGDAEMIGKRIYTNLAKSYNDSRYDHNTLVVYTMDGFLNASQASACIMNYYHYITKRMDEDGCFCGDRVGVLIQDNAVPEGVKDAKSRKYLMYAVGEVIHIGMNEATYASQREIIKPQDLRQLYHASEEQKTEPAEVEATHSKDELTESQKAVILEFTKNHLRNRSISIYPDTPVYVKRVKNGIQKDLLDNVSELEHCFCLYHLMLRTLAFTNELVVDISRNPLQSLFWLGAAHASNVDAIVVQHEASDQERTVLAGSPAKRERPIFDVAGLWNAIFQSNDTDTFYHQLRLVQEGIEQHSKLMLRNLTAYEQCLHEHLYKNTLEDGIAEIVQEKNNRETQVLESYYRDRFWKPMLKYEHLRIFIPQSDGMDSRNQYPKLNTVKWDVDAIANLSHYLSRRTHIGQYSFCTLKKNTPAEEPEKGNMIIVGSDARPLKTRDSTGVSLSAYIQEKANLADVDTSTGKNLLHSHIEIERYSPQKEDRWIYKGFVSYSSKHYHGIFSQISHPKCYNCIVSGGWNAGKRRHNPIICIQENEQDKGIKETAKMPWEPCTLQKFGVKQKQLAQLLLWREVDEKKVWFRVSMIGASGPSTMALSTLLVNESIRKKAFGLSDHDLTEEKGEQKARLQDIGHPLSDLQMEIREKLVGYYVQGINDTITEKLGQNLSPKYNEFKGQVKHAAVLYLSSVLYRYFLPFLSLEDEKKLTNGMRYYLSSLHASNILTKPRADQNLTGEELENMEKEIQEVVSKILGSAGDALETVLENFRGIEAMYEVEVEITGDENSDSRKLLDIWPYRIGRKHYVNCLSVRKETSISSDEQNQEAKVSSSPEGADAVTEKLTVNLHGRESVYAVTAKILDDNIGSGEIINIYAQGGEPSDFDCLCVDEKESAAVDESVFAALS